jgi:hypothetical protein
MSVPAPVMSSSAGPLASSRYATVPSGVRTTCMGAVSASGPLCMGAVSTSGPLPDPHPARAAAAQHTASIQLTGNLLCSARAGMMTTYFLIARCGVRVPD